MGSQDSSGGSEVVALLGLREHIRNVVALVTPGIHIHRGKEDAKGGVHYQPKPGNRLRKTETWREVVIIRIFQTLRKPILPADKCRGRSVLIKGKIGIRITD